METTIAEKPSEVWAGGIEELYVRYAPSALRLAYFLTGKRDLAEDMVQEAFVRVAGRFRQRGFPDDFGAYLRRTIVNISNSNLRRRRLERAWLARQRAEVHAVPEPDPAERDELWLSLQELPSRQRLALVLRYYEDLSEREAAGIMRCSPGALNQLVVRGMAALRNRLRKGDS